MPSPESLGDAQISILSEIEGIRVPVGLYYTKGRHFPGQKNSVRGLASASVWAGGDGFEVHTRASRRLPVQGLLDNSGYKGGSKVRLLYTAIRNRYAGFAMVCSSMGDIEEKRSGSGKRPLQSCHGPLAHGRGTGSITCARALDARLDSQKRARDTISGLPRHVRCCLFELMVK